jgi:hypothetical protein
MVGSATLLKIIIVLKKKKLAQDLKSAQLPNVRKSSIQISITLPSVMGSIVKMNFEENENLNYKLKIEVKNLD